jgi:hypothetical protein
MYTDREAPFLGTLSNDTQPCSSAPFNFTWEPIYAARNVAGSADPHAKIPLVGCFDPVF